MYIVATAILINGIDDLLIDIYYYVLQTYKFFFVHKKYKPLSEHQLREKSRQRIAVLLPAWNESKVISKMVQNTFETVDYDLFDVFIGVYPNDDATIAAV
jgi:adsorption protein B